MCYIKSASLHFNFRLCCTFFFFFEDISFSPLSSINFQLLYLLETMEKRLFLQWFSSFKHEPKKKKIRWGLLSSTRHIKTSYHRSKTSHGFFKMERGGLFTKLLLDSTWLQVQILELFNTKGIWSSLKNLDSAENT